MGDSFFLISHFAFVYASRMWAWILTWARPTFQEGESHADPKIVLFIKRWMKGALLHGASVRATL